MEEKIFEKYGIIGVAFLGIVVFVFQRYGGVWFDTAVAFISRFIKSKHSNYKEWKELAHHDIFTTLYSTETFLSDSIYGENEGVKKTAVHFINTKAQAIDKAVNDIILQTHLADVSTNEFAAENTKRYNAFIRSYISELYNKGGNNMFFTKYREYHSQKEQIYGDMIQLIAKSNFYTNNTTKQAVIFIIYEIELRSAIADMNEFIKDFME